MVIIIICLIILVLAVYASAALVANGLESKYQDDFELFQEIQRQIKDNEDKKSLSKDEDKTA